VTALSFGEPSCPACQGRYVPTMRPTTRAHGIASTLKLVQLVLYIFIAVYAFAGWTFADHLITLKSVMLLVLAGAALQRLALLIPGPRSSRSRPNRLALASL
jgi:hypothetical protein